MYILFWLKIDLFFYKWGENLVIKIHDIQVQGHEFETPVPVLKTDMLLQFLHAQHWGKKSGISMVHIILPA